MIDFVIKQFLSQLEIVNFFFMKVCGFCSSILFIDIRSIIHYVNREKIIPKVNFEREITVSPWNSRIWITLIWKSWLITSATRRMNHYFTLVCEAALIGNIPITGLSTRNNSAICGAILSSHIGQRTVSYFHLEFSFSSRSGQHDERCDLLHYTRSFYRGHWIAEESSSGSGKRRKTPGMIFFKMSRKRSRTLMAMLFAY